MKGKIMRRKIDFLRSGLIMSLFLVVVLIGSGCKDNSTNAYSSPGGGTTPPDNEVWMQNTSFNPKNKTITAGTTITWVNKDSYDHTVTSGTPGHPDGKFSSGTLGSGAVYTHTFNTQGTFNYYCSIHQDIMTGSITVQ